MPKLTNTPLSALSLNEDARPKAPSIGDGQAAPTNNGLHLAAIHRHHLSELSKTRAVLNHARTGKAEPQALLDALKNMTLTENMRIFGSLCGQECRMLEFHHNAEEHHMFPELEAQEIDGLSAVVAKLREEHKVAHGLLHRLQRAAENLVKVPEEQEFEIAAEIFEKLDAIIRSHFRYEETELRDALDHLVPQI